MLCPLRGRARPPAPSSTSRPAHQPGGVNCAERQLTRRPSRPDRPAAHWPRPCRALGSEARLVHGGTGTESCPHRRAEPGGGAGRERPHRGPRAASRGRRAAGPPFAEILGGRPEHNGRAFAALLDGAPSAYRDAVCLNAAAALVIAGRAADLHEGVAIARESIDSGAARACLRKLAAITGEAAGTEGSSGAPRPGKAESTP